MARPVWTGVLSFGLVTVPVALYTATEQHTVAFHQLQRGTSDRVRNKRVNERTGLDITGFVDLDEVDPIFFDRTYYLGPRGAEYTKVYALLVQALERSDRAGLAMFAMRGKEYLTAVGSRRGMLELHTMHFADEVRDPREEIEDLPGPGAKASTKELDAAGQLIDTMAVDWDPEEYHDTYAEQVRRLVENKAAGHEIAVAEGPPAEATNVVDLMDVLQRSLEGVRGGRAQRGAGGARRGRGGGDGDGSGARRGSGRGSAARAGAGAGSRSRAGAKKPREDLDRLSKAELYRRASELDVPKRSGMNRDQLIQAVRAAQSRGSHAAA